MADSVNLAKSANKLEKTFFEEENSTIDGNSIMVISSTNSIKKKRSPISSMSSDSTKIEVKFDSIDKSSSFRDEEVLKQENQNWLKELRDCKEENKFLKEHCIFLKNKIEILNKRIAELSNSKELEDYVDVHGIISNRKIEFLLSETNGMLNDETKLREAMLYLVNNIWSAMAHEYIDTPLEELKQLKQDLVNKIDRSITTISSQMNVKDKTEKRDESPQTVQNRTKEGEGSIIIENVAAIENSLSFISEASSIKLDSDNIKLKIEEQNRIIRSLIRSLDSIKPNAPDKKLFSLRRDQEKESFAIDNENKNEKEPVLAVNEPSVEEKNHDEEDLAEFTPSQSPDSYFIANFKHLFKRPPSQKETKEQEKNNLKQMSASAYESSSKIQEDNDFVLSTKDDLTLISQKNSSPSPKSNSFVKTLTSLTKAVSNSHIFDNSKRKSQETERKNRNSETDALYAFNINGFIAVDNSLELYKHFDEKNLNEEETKSTLETSPKEFILKCPKCNICVSGSSIPKDSYEEHVKNCETIDMSCMICLRPFKINQQKEYEDHINEHLEQTTRC
jgi:hypothetical protein